MQIHHNADETTSVTPGLRKLLARARRQLKAVHSSLVWLTYPFAAIGRSDRDEAEWEYAKLDSLAAAIGSRLVRGDACAGAIDGKCLVELQAHIGHTLIKELFADLIRKQDHKRELVRDGKWNELHHLGMFDDEDLQDLLVNFPDGNPWYLETPASSDQDSVAEVRTDPI